jgi:ABC-2 type transport system ATP-binding protein
MMTARIRHISKKYRRQLVLHDVTLDVRRGEILGLIGPNGAGKTTLLRIVSGLVRPNSGRVDMDFPSSPVTLRYFGGEHTLPGDVPTRRWQALWGLAADHRSTGRMRLLSRGTRQRVGLEATLRLPEPSLVVLDEPWEGLDPDASRWLSDELLLLSQRGSGIILSSHRIHDLAEVCTRCVFLVLGHLV